MTLRDVLETHRANLIKQIHQTDALLAALEENKLQIVYPEPENEKTWWLLEALYLFRPQTTTQLVKRSGIPLGTIKWHLVAHPELFAREGNRVIRWSLTERGYALIERHLATKNALRNGKY